MAGVYPYGYVAFHELLDWVRTHPLPDGRILPVCVWGGRGVGKTQSIHAYCKMNDLNFRGFQPALASQGADVVGIPYRDEKTNQLAYALPSWIPQLHDEDVQNGKGGLIFVDEVNRAPMEVIQGLFEPLGEGEISLARWKLPPGWSFVCAANPPEEGYNVNKMDIAFLNRMINYSPGWSESEWVNWAELFGNLPARIIDLALRNPNLVDSGDPRLPGEVNPAATPRSLTYMGALYTDKMPLRLLHTIGIGLIGEDATEALVRDHDEDPALAPLTGKEILQGKTERGTNAIDELRQRQEEGDSSFVRASTTRAIAVLYRVRDLPSNEPDKVREHPFTKNFLNWYLAMDKKYHGETIYRLQESIPAWLEHFMTIPAFLEAMPDSRLIKKPEATEIAREQTALRKKRGDQQWREDVNNTLNSIDDIDDDELDILAGLD